MTPSRHDDLTALLGPAALGLLTTPEQEQLERHLATCPTCREELAALTAVAGHLGDLDTDSALSLGAPARADAVLATVARERRRGQRLQAVLAAAASVAVLLAGLVAAGSLDADPVATVPVEAVAVRGEVEATAGLVAHTWGVEIKLVAAGLAEGRPYSVQVLTQDGEVVGAGAFIGTGAKPLFCNLNTSVLREDARSFAVLDSSGRMVLTADL